MAEVYKAYQPGLDRYVGIKVLHAHLVDDKDFIGRFEREALAIGKLRHPNIVQALDFDREVETYFMVMEYIDGPTLKAELNARKASGQFLTLQETSRIFTALCSAIDYAHARGMVHRDIKPANVMINDEGQIVLTDFGIARIVGATQYTQTGALSGTPAYMSPEQGQGERGDELSDIYSLGVMLYEMVTGMVPYDADTPFAVIMKHVNEPLPLPTRMNPNLPESVERVVLKAMSKEPDDRYQSAGEMATALRDAVGISVNDNLQRNPVTTVASSPKVDQIEHRTGPITSMERTVAGGIDGDATAWSSGNEATTVAAPPAKGLPMLPVLTGVGIVIIVALVGVIGFLALSGRQAEPTPARDATGTIIAIAAVTSEALLAQETVNDAAETAAATTATAEVLAPTETVRVATAEAERIAATEYAQATRNADLVGGILATAQVATAEAATAEAIVAETATAEVIASFTDTPTPAPATNTPTPAPAANTPTPAPPTNTPTPERPPISGKLAFPVDNGFGNYDVLIFSMPDGQELGKVQGARQPYFRGDGQKLLVNGQGGGFGENIFVAGPTGAIEGAVSGSPTDLYPVYKFDGTTIAYSNPELAVGSDGARHSYLFVQCSVRPPSEESDKCVEMSQWNLIVPAGQVGEVQGVKPVWTSSDRLVYSGCNSWAGGGSCGLFMVGSWATKRVSNGETPQKLVDGTSVFPTDAKAGLIAFQSREPGDWEAFVMGEGGGGLATNISNSPGSRDGLPTISSDGQWVAFASDRTGGWAIYVVPSSGGQAQKLFDFPKPNPWGTGDRDWTNERMSWGP
jgi:hypothetical protein